MTNDLAAREAHNDYQREYFSTRELPRMTIDPAGGTPYVRRHVDAVVAAAGLTGADPVLDVGCGIGKYTAELARRGLNVEGMDLTAALIEALHSAEPGIKAHVADIASPPAHLRDRFYATVGFMVLHHVADLAQTFRGVRETLLPGGRIAFLEPNPYFAGYYAQIGFTPGMTFRGEGGIVKLRPQVLRDALAEAGFTSIRITRFGAFPPALANRPLGAKVERGLESIPGWTAAKAFQVISATRA